jgi:L-fuconolactonase
MDDQLPSPDFRHDSPGSRAIVDSHCHLWQLELAALSGLTPEFAPIYRSFTPDHLAAEARPMGVSTCVLVESGKTAEENRALEETADSAPWIAAMTPYIDPADPSLEKKLEAWSRSPKFRGVRARFEAHPDSDILSRPEVIQGIRLIAERGVVFELLVRAGHLRQVLDVYEQVPTLRAVVEHMAKPDVVEGSDADPWQPAMAALAAHTPVLCKLSLSPRVEQMHSLLATPRSGWPVEALKPFVRSLLEWFGPDRLMWGSDWPICLLIDSYRETMQAMRDALGAVAREDEERIFRTTAAHFYHLAAPGPSPDIRHAHEVHPR